MWKFLIVVLLPVLASTKSFVELPDTEEEILQTYKTARTLLTPEQEEFLMELLAADDALIEAHSRGIVDDILQILSGTGNNIRVNIIGGSANPGQQQPPQQPIPISPSVSIPIYNRQQQQQQPAPVYNNGQQQQPAQQPQPVNIINPTITVVSTPTNSEKTLVNSSDTSNLAVTSTMSSSSTSTTTNTTATSTSAPMPMSDLSPSPISTGSYQGSIPGSSQGGSVSPPYYQGSSMTGSSNNPYQGGSNAVQQQQMQSNITTIGGNNNHLFATISQVIRNSNSRNVTGIVDESLRIATPAPIREFVTGILNVVYCNGIRRLLGRC